MNELALFAGAGGGILAGQMLGWRTVCAVEWEPYPASVLAQRQNDGLLPPFPIWDDVCNFDGRPWRGIVDVVSGGFPCQDISVAGKGAGIDGERSGLWSEFARIIREVRPKYAYIENSPMLTLRGLDRVLCDLAAMGFDAKWCVLGANAVGAPHRRDRIWIVANARGRRLFESGGGEVQQSGRTKTIGPGKIMADACLPGLAFGEMLEECSSQTAKTLTGQDACLGRHLANTHGCDGHRRSSPLQVGRKWIQRKAAKYGDAARIEWSSEPDVGRVAHGVAARVDRLKAIGNGQVPQCAAEAWRILTGMRG